MTVTDESPDDAILVVDDIRLSFGGIHALSDVSFTVPRGQICGLIGPNGAGKTTMFNCITRLYTPDSGRVRFNGTEVLARKPHELAGLGIARTFQNLGLFSSLDVLGNVMLGAHARSQGNFVSGALRTAGLRRSDRNSRQLASDLLDLLELGDVRHENVNDLPFGTLKRVELARALAAQPQLLLLDEPACGLTQSEVTDLGRLLQRVQAEFDLSILLVEHHMGIVMSVSHKVIVLDFGKLVSQGTPEAVQRDPVVIEAYLGTAS